MQASLVAKEGEGVVGQERAGSGTAAAGTSSAVFGGSCEATGLESLCLHGGGQCSGSRESSLTESSNLSPSLTSIFGEPEVNHWDYMGS